MNDNNSVLIISKLNKSYTGNGIVRKVINDVSFSVARRSFCAIMGPSGSGKTTLLNLISGIDNADSGEIVVDQQDVTELSRNEIALFRRDHVGVVYQDFNLIDSLDVKENIILPMHLEEMTLDEIDEKVGTIATLLGIDHLMDKPVYGISGGEQQRVAICRAIINDPDILLADEPTGNLDSRSTQSVMECFDQMNKKSSSTIMMVTHDAFSASFCKEVLFFDDGAITKRIENDTTREGFYKRILTELDQQGGSTDEPQ